MAYECAGAQMRSKPMRWWGIALAGLGALCLIATALLVWVFVPNNKQLPADTDTTRDYSGTAAFLLNPSALASGDLRNALLRDVPVTAQRNVKVTDTDGDTAQVVDSRSLSLQGTQVGGTQVTYAVDRTSLEAAPAPEGWTVTPHEGLTVNYPIGAKQEDYPAWVNETQTTTTATYLREEEKDGLNTYVYEAKAPAAPIKDPQVLGTLPQSLPGRVVGELAASLPLPDAVKAQLGQLLPALGEPVPLSYTYESTTTVWVEPTTGIVVDTQRREIRRASLGAAAGLAVPVYDVTTAFTPDSVTQAVDDANDDKGKIDLYGTTLPWILGILGGLLLIAGVILLVLGMRKPGPPRNGEHDVAAPVPG